MVTSWIYARIWFFPVHIIGRIFEEIQNWPEQTWNWNFAIMMPSFLIALAFMHVFWLYIMIRGLVKRCGKKNWKDSISLKKNENRGD